MSVSLKILQIIH